MRHLPADPPVTGPPSLAQVPEFYPIPPGMARGEPQEPVQA